MTFGTLVLVLIGAGIAAAGMVASRNWLVWLVALILMVLSVSLARLLGAEVGMASVVYPGDSGAATMATGERGDPGGLTAAHKTLPLNSLVEVTSLARPRHVVVRINDRGPFKPGRVIDLTPAAAAALGLDGGGAVRLAQAPQDGCTFAERFEAALWTGSPPPDRWGCTGKNVPRETAKEKPHEQTDKTADHRRPDPRRHRRRSGSKRSH